jgi:hypothetical protein
MDEKDVLWVNRLEKDMYLRRFINRRYVRNRFCLRGCSKGIFDIVIHDDLVWEDLDCASGASVNTNARLFRASNEAYLNEC